MNDNGQNKGFLRPHQVNMTPEELRNLILLRKDGKERLDPERKGRANTTFSFHANLPILAECIDQNTAAGDKTLQFPKDSH